MLIQKFIRVNLYETILHDYTLFLMHMASKNRPNFFLFGQFLHVCSTTCEFESSIERKLTVFNKFVSTEGVFRHVLWVTCPNFFWVQVPYIREQLFSFLFSSQSYKSITVLGHTVFYVYTVVNSCVREETGQGFVPRVTEQCERQVCHTPAG